MLIIRNEQMQSLADSLNESLRDEIIKCLQTDYPVLIQNLSEEELDTRVTNGVSRAKRYGLGRKVDITSFVVLMFNIAPNFDLYPEIHKTLSNSSIPSYSRLDLIIEDTTGSQWDEMRARYDEAAWAENFDERRKI